MKGNGPGPADVRGYYCRSCYCSRMSSFLVGWLHPVLMCYLFYHSFLMSLHPWASSKLDNTVSRWCLLKTRCLWNSKSFPIGPADISVLFALVWAWKSTGVGVDWWLLIACDSWRPFTSQSTLQYNSSAQRAIKGERKIHVRLKKLHIMMNTILKFQEVKDCEFYDFVGTVV